MILLPDLKAVYVSCPRTGSHTMFAVLTNRYGGSHYEPWDDYHRRDILPDCADWYKFTNVRNPYSRAVSIWRAMGMERKFRVAEMTFAAFAENLANGKLIAWRITLAQHVWHGENEYDEILKVESLDEDAKRLSFWNGPDHIPVATNTTQGRPWIDEYTGAIARDIETWAGPEFERYGYERLT